ncbi:MAG: hypothetical protein U0T82_16985 [Bacteroidales bacterium]
MTNTIHIYTAYIPVWILIVGGILALAGILLKNEAYLKISVWLLWAGILVSIFTGAMGGASMSKTKILPGINNASLHVHAWTSAIAILLFMITTGIAVRRKRAMKNGKSLKKWNVLFLTFLFGIAIFLFWTIRVAHQIRL